MWDHSARETRHQVVLAVQGRPHDAHVLHHLPVLLVVSFPQLQGSQRPNLDSQPVDDPVHLLAVWHLHARHHVRGLNLPRLRGPARLARVRLPHGLEVAPLPEGRARGPPLPPLAGLLPRPGHRERRCALGPSRALAPLLVPPSEEVRKHSVQLRGAQPAPALAICGRALRLGRAQPHNGRQLQRPQAWAPVKGTAWRAAAWHHTERAAYRAGRRCAAAGALAGQAVERTPGVAQTVLLEARKP
mmetsp:Transcript_141718/g.395125  ORF Transcript_141718/g.395125 Transcript_141718/m.395125 type:complete len:244 (-) Transcript_141718:492-1223(-)